MAEGQREYADLWMRSAPLKHSALQSISPGHADHTDDCKLFEDRANVLDGDYLCWSACSQVGSTAAKGRCVHATCSNGLSPGSEACLALRLEVCKGVSLHSSLHG